jgi:hypothetical protein
MKSRHKISDPNDKISLRGWVIVYILNHETIKNHSQNHHQTINN